MKLRQKLAVVLASAMVLSAVPVVTMAASTNSLSKETLKVAKDCEFTDVSTANAVKIKFTDTNNTSEVFYLDLENAEWDTDVLDAVAASTTGQNADFTKNGSVWEYTGNAGVKVTYARQNDKTMMITVATTGTTGTITQTTPIQIPVIAKAKDGDAKVSIVSMGGATTVSKGTFVFATTAEKKISVTAESDKTFYTKGELSKITITEAYKGSLDTQAKFVIELDDSDYQFDSATFTLEGKYGFSTFGKNTTYTGVISTTDPGKMTITLPAMPNQSTEGTFEITGLKVKSTNKKPQEGDFLVDIKNADNSDDLVAEKTNVKVATVSNYSVYVKMADEKAEDVKAGRIEEVEFTVGENVEDSMITDREFEMTLDNGHWDYKALVDKALANSSASGVTQTIVKAAGATLVRDNAGNETNEIDTATDKQYKAIATKIDTKWLAAEILDNDSDWMPNTCEAEFDVDSDGRAIPETIIFTIGRDDKATNSSVQTNNENDELKFKTNICVPVSNKEKEKVTLSIAGRGIENEASTTAINIVNPFDITTEQAVLKTGLQGQVSGKLVITEKDKDMLQKGTLTVKVKKDNEYFGIYLTDADIVVSDGLKGTKDDIKKGNTSENASMNITLNRVSKEAATLSFENMTFTTDRTVPEGTYDLELSGTAIDADGHKITIKDFIKISTSNTQDITANGLAKGTASFVIGESKYVLNGQEVTMDAPSYIQDPGYTMVPVRYVAQAFGVSAADILFGKGTVTIFAGERTISLTTGSNIAVVNGNNVALETAVVNKDGRTYVPAGQIASILGIKSTWTSETKTATFENN